MPTPTAEMKANRSADRRLDEYARRLAKARADDRRLGHHDQKLEWAVVLGWLLAESKNLGDDDRARMLDYLLACAKQMNDATRVKSQYTHSP